MIKRRCSRCGETKPETEFWRDARTPTGRRSVCRTCTNDRTDTTGGAWTPQRAFREYMKDRTR